MIIFDILSLNIHIGLSGPNLKCVCRKIALRKNVTVPYFVPSGKKTDQSGFIESVAFHLGRPLMSDKHRFKDWRYFQIFLSAVEYQK